LRHNKKVEWCIGNHVSMPSATCRSSMSGSRLPKNSALLCFALLCFSEGVQSLSDKVTQTSFCVPVLKWSALLLLLKKIFYGFGRHLHVDIHCADADRSVLCWMNLAPLPSSTVVESRVQCLRHVEQVVTESDRRVRITINFEDVNRRCSTYTFFTHPKLDKFE
jgi:hypothetical protein